MARPRTTAALVLALLGASLAAAGAPFPVRERGWAPLVRLVGAGTTPDALPRIDSGLVTLRALLHGFSPDEPARELFSRIGDRLGSLDLESLHEMLPEPDGPWRRARFAGRREGDRYSVASVAHAAPCSCVPDGAFGGRFLDLALSLATRQAPPRAGEDEARNYLARWRAELGLGEGSSSGLVASLAAALALAESGAPEVSSRLERAARPPAATLARVARESPGLGPEDVEVLAVLDEAFPRTSARLRELVRLEDVLAVDPAGGDPWRQVRVAGTLRRDAIAARFPALAEHLESLGALAEGSVQLVDARGRPLAWIAFSTRRLRLEAGAFVRDGKVLPVENGRPLVDEGVDLSALRSGSFRARHRVTFDANGIVFELRDLVLSFRYESDGDRLLLRGRIEEEPSVKVSGAAYGIVPAWAIDLAIPGDMEALAREFLHVLARGNAGEGLALSVRARRGTRTSVLDLDGTAEVLDNAVLRLAFRIARRRLPGEEARADIARVLRELRQALSEDRELLRGERPEGR